MPKLLGEFLQEQQEPFSLEVYLLERGRNQNSGRYNSGEFCSIKKKRRYYAVPNCTDYLKAVFSQLAMANSIQKLKLNARIGILKCRQENSSHEDRFSCTDSDVGPTHCPAADMMKTGSLFLQGEIEADRKFKWRGAEDSKQLSPISVLEETESDGDSPIHNKQGESSNTISQRKLKKAAHCKSQELEGSNSYDQYNINKRALQQRKQLLIDCVRQVIEKHRRGDNSREELQKILGAEELWKLVCENVWMWSQDSINESNIFHQLHRDFLASEDEWNADSEQQKMEICKEIENAILEEIIYEI